MRYSIMLQLVAGTTLILVGAAALFAGIQNRTEPVKFRIHPVSSVADGFSIAQAHPLRVVGSNNLTQLTLGLVGRRPAFGNRN